MSEENVVIQKAERIGLVKLRIVILHLGALAAIHYPRTLLYSYWPRRAS
ncbi:hypothetical protein H9L41_10885 [Chitinimonas koreensis]|nr:hypothetical protein H9L41_10885 [Chitinimonas koreensis]